MSGNGPMQEHADHTCAKFADKARKAIQAIREVMFGLTLHEMNLELRKDRGRLNNMFMLAVFGDLLGLPLLPPYYSMRLLPYVVPNIRRWKRSLLRERDLTDLGTVDL